MANKILFVGGATVSLYTDRPFGEMRPTDDVDILIELVDYTGFTQVEEQLRRKGFVNDIEFPPDCIVLGVLRGSTLHLNMAKLKIMPKDHVILLLLNKKYIQQLETLFQVNLDFLS